MDELCIYPLCSCMLLCVALQEAPNRHLHRFLTYVKKDWVYISSNEKGSLKCALERLPNYQSVVDKTGIYTWECRYSRSVISICVSVFLYRE